jgi:hypothetical protein
MTPLQEKTRPHTTAGNVLAATINGSYSTQIVQTSRQLPVLQTKMSPSNSGLQAADPVLASVWSGLGGKLADRWAAALFSPGLLYWAGVLLTWVYAYGGPEISKLGLVGAIANWSSPLGHLPVIAQILLAGAALFVVTASGLILQRASLPTLRILEGYWPLWLSVPQEWFRHRLSDRIDADVRRLRQLGMGTLESKETAERSRLEHRRRRAPVDTARRMPTRAGNILRAAETRPRDRYGLETTLFWPRLWLVLPDEARQEVIAARSVLYLAVQAWLAGIAFCLWAFWAWWAVPVGLTVAIGAYYLRILGACETYGDLVESCYDIYRGELYAALRFTKPASPAAERAAGQTLSTYLRSGSRSPTPFTD